MKKEKKLLRTILRVTAVSLCAGIAGVNLYLFNAAKLAGNAAPMPFGVGISVVLSGSMEPALSVGDMIIAVEADDYSVGDVVVYQSGSSAIVHRIVDIYGDTVITQGDANNALDEPVSLNNIKGRVVASVPGLGYVMSFLKTPVGMLLLLAAAVLMLELSFNSYKQDKTDEIERIKAEIRALQADHREGTSDYEIQEKKKS